MGNKPARAVSSLNLKEDILKDDDDVANGNAAFITYVEKSHGIVSVGNEFRNTFTDCQNVTVILHQMESQDPSPLVFKDISQHEFNKYLHDLQESLRILYSGEESWMLPFPWMQSRKFQPEYYFIHMDIQELDRMGKKVTRKNVSVDVILEPLDENSDVAPRRTLLEADAGFGKGTTCTKIALQWSEKVKTNFHKFELIILVRLRTLDCSLDDYVCQFAMSASKVSVEKDIMIPLLSNLGNKLLLLLDGLDECPAEHLNSVKRVIAFDHGSKHQSYLIGATILMTTRPSLITSSILLSDRYIRIRSISDQEVEQFVRKYFNSDKSANSVLRLLSNADFRSDLSPLMLFLICYLEEEGQLTRLVTETNVFLKLLKLLTRRYVSKEHLEWSEQDVEDNLGELGEICFQMLKQKKTFFSEDEISELCSCPEHFVTGCGVFKKRYSIESYEPVHKMFLEHLAVLYLQRKCNEIASPLEKLAFVQSIIQKPKVTWVNKVLVHDFEEGKICIQCHIIYQVIDVHVTKPYGIGKTSDDITVEIMLRSDSVTKLQHWRSVKSPFTLQCTSQLCYIPNDSSSILASIPEMIRNEIVHFTNEPGFVVCDLVVHRKCACSLDRTMIQKNDRSIRHLKLFSYYFRKQTCDECTFLKRPDLAELVLTAKKRATSFVIRMTVQQMNDSQDLLQNACASSTDDVPGITTKTTFKGDMQHISAILHFALKEHSTSAPFENNYKTVGSFLSGLVRSLEFSELSHKMSQTGKKYALRIFYKCRFYSFVRYEQRKSKMKLAVDGEQKMFYALAVKKLLKEWDSDDNGNTQNTMFVLNFFNTAKELSCEIAVQPREESKPCLAKDYFVWKRLSI